MLKTLVQLILNSTRPHVITYTNKEGETKCSIHPLTLFSRTALKNTHAFERTGTTDHLIKFFQLFSSKNDISTADFENFLFKFL